MTMTSRHIIIGTAGHIDHGKSALIKSLTGYDPDRLKEEKERGMTTDLGFAFYRDDVTIIDVPGHEKFIRHMVAGASTIDFVLFVIAANDSLMPQTIEHLEILKLLGIKKGIIVLTKKDLVKDDWLKLVIDETKNLVKDTFLENAPIVAISNTTGEGINELKRMIDEYISGIKEKEDRGVFRMPIDRCFSMKGFGTVVAGTILSGKVKVGEAVELLPHGKEVKIRGIEVHNQKVDEVGTGYRAAINIIGAEKDEIKRGNILSQIGYHKPSIYMNASLVLLKSAKPLKNFTRLRIHLIANEVLGRIVFLDRKILEPGDKAMVQFRLEEAAVSDIGDQYVIRTYSPQETIGGGAIIEPRANKVKGFDEDLIEHMQRVEFGNPLVIVEENLNINQELPRKIEEIARDVGLPIAMINELINKLKNDKKVICTDEKRGLYYLKENLKNLKSRIIDELNSFYKTDPTGIAVSQLELHRKIGVNYDRSLLVFVLKEMSQEKRIVIADDGKISLHGHKVDLDPQLDATIKKIEKIFLDAEYKTPDIGELTAMNIGSEHLIKKAHKYMLDSGTLINVGENIVFHKVMVKQAEERLVALLKKKNELRVSDFRDLINASRKYALPLLIYFDTHNVTIKRGDIRVMGQKYR